MPLSRTLLLSCTCILGLQVAGHAQLGGAAPETDKRAKKALDKADLKYTVDADGDFQIVFSYDDDRSQAVFMKSATQKVGAIEVREVFSYAYRSTDPLPTSAAVDALKDNTTRKIGAWELLEGNGKQALSFSVKIDATTGPDALVTILRAVAQTADEREKELLGTDEF
jgi:hypothetical protein